MEGIYQRHVRRRKKHPGNPIDKLIFVAGLIGPIMTIPQVLEVWLRKDATGISLITWSTYLAAAFFWLYYGIVHKEKAIILSYLGWILFQGLVVLGAVLY